MDGQPKAPFYVVLFLVVGGLLAFAAYRSDMFAPKGASDTERPGDGDIDPGELGPNGRSSRYRRASRRSRNTRSARPSGCRRSRALSAYKPLEDNTVRFALNVWAGWGPIILANDGFKPGKVWKTPDGKEFKVELVLIDDPVAMRDAYAAGEVHIGWATLDMVPLFMEGFVDKTASRATAASCRASTSRSTGPTAATASWSARRSRPWPTCAARSSCWPRIRRRTISLLNMLVAGGVQPSEVEHDLHRRRFRGGRGVQRAEGHLPAAVSWAPDIYNLAEVQGNRMLVTTQTANKLIADVWFARADFAKDHPDMIEGLVRGIFDAMEELKKDDQQSRSCAKLMAEGYNIPASDAIEHVRRRPQHQLGRELSVLPQPEQPDELRARLEPGLLPLSPHRRDHAPAGAVRPGDGLLRHREARQGGEIPVAEGRVPGPARAEGRRPRSRPSRTRSSPTRSSSTSIPTVGTCTRRSPATTTARRSKSCTTRTSTSCWRRSPSWPGSSAPRGSSSRATPTARCEGQVPQSLVKELTLNRANAVEEALVNKFKLDPNGSPSRAWAGTGPPTPTTRRTTPRTAAWKSRSTRPRSSERQARMGDATKPDPLNPESSRRPSSAVVRADTRRSARPTSPRERQRAAVFSLSPARSALAGASCSACCASRAVLGAVVVSHARRAGGADSQLFIAAQPGGDVRHDEQLRRPCGSTTH